MNSEREKADILFNYGLPLQICCHLIQFYTVLSLRTATLTHVPRYRRINSPALRWDEHAAILLFPRSQAVTSVAVRCLRKSDKIIAGKLDFLLSFA